MAPRAGRLENSWFDTSRNPDAQRKSLLAPESDKAVDHPYIAPERALQIGAIIAELKKRGMSLKDIEIAIKMNAPLNHPAVLNFSVMMSTNPVARNQAIDNAVQASADKVVSQAAVNQVAAPGEQSSSSPTPAAPAQASGRESAGREVSSEVLLGVLQAMTAAAALGAAVEKTARVLGSRGDAGPSLELPTPTLSLTTSTS